MSKYFTSLCNGTRDYLCISNLFNKSSSSLHYSILVYVLYIIYIYIYIYVFKYKAVCLFETISLLLSHRYVITPIDKYTLRNTAIYSNPSSLNGRIRTLLHNFTSGCTDLCIAFIRVLIGSFYDVTNGTAYFETEMASTYIIWHCGMKWKRNEVKIVISMIVKTIMIAIAGVQTRKISFTTTTQPLIQTF
jgi:hypothetical protein